MAVDEAEDASKLERRPETEVWQSGEAILVGDGDTKEAKPPTSVTDWVKGVVLGVFGRGAPA
jgi:hypothetical protein